jgi:hypothetical protein
MWDHVLLSTLVKGAHSPPALYCRRRCRHDCLSCAVALQLVSAASFRAWHSHDELRAKAQTRNVHSRCWRTWGGSAPWQSQPTRLSCLRCMREFAFVRVLGYSSMCLYACAGNMLRRLRVARLLIASLGNLAVVEMCSLLGSTAGATCGCVDAPCCNACNMLCCAVLLQDEPGDNAD